MSKKRKNLTKDKRSLSSVLLILLGILLLSFYSFLKFRQTNIAFSQMPDLVYEHSNASSLPSRILIPKTNTNVEIKEAKIHSGVWEINPDGASHLADSASIGGGGNIIIYGHNKNNIFGSMKLLENGDKIILVSEDKSEHLYEIKQTLIVSPKQMEVLGQTQHEVLTLYTCIGLFDSKRLVIKAYPLS